MLRVEAEQHWMCLETGLWEGGANEDLIRGSMRKPNGEVGTRYCVHVNMCQLLLIRNTSTRTGGKRSSSSGTG